MPTQLEPIQRLKRDLVIAAADLSDNEARYLVDSYYQIQEMRKATANQVRAMGESIEPNSVISWFRDQSEGLESQIKRALQSYAEGKRVGRWALSIYGIGPVISAGLLAYLGDPAKIVTDKKTGLERHQAPSAGHIWSFAGLEPKVVWEKGQKRPFNAGLKTLCWKVGQSFLKFSNEEECVYGRLLRQRWESEKQHNERGELADQAKAKLEKFKIRKSTEAYKHYSQGHLPPAHILQRACRYSTKLFLSHWHWVAWESSTGAAPEKPYVITHLGHTNLIIPPNWPCE